MIAKRQSPPKRFKFTPRTPNRARSPIWLIGIVLLVAVYGITQPWLQRQFGGKLPAPVVADSDPREPESSPVDSFLEEIAEKTFRSPAGLIYKRGSAEGHRLKHLERHLQDLPERPGPHGVFRGNLTEFLQAIDHAYLRAKKKESGTSISYDAGRSILEVRFSGDIGFLGGQEGKRKANPPLRRLKIILDDDSVITAYPF